MTLVLQIAALVGLAIAGWQLAEARGQRQRNFEALFVQRYWTIVDGMTVEALYGRPPQEPNITEEDRRAVLSYLRLCEDEIGLWEAGWISPMAWKEWASGIDASLQRWPIDVLWAEICAQETEAGEDGQFVRLRALRPPYGDQEPWPRRRGWIGRSLGSIRSA